MIKPKMWRNVAQQIGVSANLWSGVEARDYKVFNRLMKDTQSNALVMTVTGEAGTGKSFAEKPYV
ncbi:MAG: hypothetical protein ACRC9X_01845 [Bacteroidales bacterium]